MAINNYFIVKFFSMKNNRSFQKESQKMSKNKLHFNEFKRKLRKIITNLRANFAREIEFWRHIPDHFYSWCFCAQPMVPSHGEGGRGLAIMRKI
jgi:retron-type reverse transcriptase